MAQHADETSTTRRTYPVVDSAELQPAPLRRFRRQRRELHEIPRQPPGCLLVFQVADAYDVPTGGPLRLDDDLIVEAVSVAVVSMVLEVRDIEVQVPTTNPDIAVTVRARYHCLVTDPLLVLESGCWDADPWLRRHLHCGNRVGAIALGTDVLANWTYVHNNIHANVKAFHDVVQYIVPGMTTQLVDLAVVRTAVTTVPRPRPPAEEQADPWAGHQPFGDTPPDQAPYDDGHPSFVPGHYSWEDDTP
ncbi:hypothetical protein [Dactylosporangium sp. CA-092794]|uniref:hypothetical protein n=1 Tax=Dactylosporangium sp. CA-092794 TaxID=3239929 RepID=UPI003D92FBBD